MSELVRQWGASDAAAWIRVPEEHDNKYSHGVLGVVTGSAVYPGAAILGIQAAHHAGIGMVRYLGNPEVAKLVLAARPEVVTVDGKVDAWLLGSGMDAQKLTRDEIDSLALALRRTEPKVLDAGALNFLDEALGTLIITPHAGELERLIAQGKDEPSAWAQRAANELDVVVVLKGHTTLIAAPAHTEVYSVSAGTTWLATAGSGDVLAGIISALLTACGENYLGSFESYAAIAATGVYLHQEAAFAASQNGPFPALEIANFLSQSVATLIQYKDGGTL